MALNKGLTRIKSRLGTYMGSGSYDDMIKNVQKQGAAYKFDRVQIDVDDNGDAEAAFQFRNLEGDKQYYPFAVRRHSNIAAYTKMSNAAKSIGVDMPLKKMLALQAGRYDITVESTLNENAAKYKLAIIDFNNDLELRKGMTVLGGMGDGYRFTNSDDRRRPNAIIFRNIRRDRWEAVVDRLTRMRVGFRQDVVDLTRDRDPGYAKTDWDNQARGQSPRSDSRLDTYNPRDISRRKINRAIRGMTKESTNRYTTELKFELVASNHNSNEITILLNGTRYTQRMKPGQLSSKNMWERLRETIKYSPGKSLQYLLKRSDTVEKNDRKYTAESFTDISHQPSKLGPVMRIVWKNKDGSMRSDDYVDNPMDYDSAKMMAREGVMYGDNVACLYDADMNKVEIDLPPSAPRPIIT